MTFGILKLRRHSHLGDVLVQVSDVVCDETVECGKQFSTDAIWLESLGNLLLQRRHEVLLRSVAEEHSLFRSQGAQVVQPSVAMSAASKQHT